MKFGNDQIVDMANFDETSRWIIEPAEPLACRRGSALDR